jgi:hypothetical protein
MQSLRDEPTTGFDPRRPVATVCYRDVMPCRHPAAAGSEPPHLAIGGSLAASSTTCTSADASNVRDSAATLLVSKRSG